MLRHPHAPGAAARPLVAGAAAGLTSTVELPKPAGYQVIGPIRSLVA